MSCNSPGCEQKASRNGYCQEHAEYLEQNTTLFCGPPSHPRNFACMARWALLILFIAAAIHP